MRSRLLPGVAVAVAVVLVGLAAFSVGRSSGSPAAAATVSAEVATSAPHLSATPSAASPASRASARGSSARPTSTVSYPSDGTGGTVLPAGTAVALGGGSAVTAADHYPYGYAHTPDGAAAAATNLAAWAYCVVLSRPDEVAAVVQPTADPVQRATGTSSTWTQELTESSAFVARAGTVSCDPRRGAYAVVSYTADRAQVAVWYRSVLVFTSWYVVVATVVWVDGDWRAQSRILTSVAKVPEDVDGHPSAHEKWGVLTRAAGDDTAYNTQTYSWREYANATH